MFRILPLPLVKKKIVYFKVFFILPHPYWDAFCPLNSPTKHLVPPLRVKFPTVTSKFQHITLSLDKLKFNLSSELDYDFVASQDVCGRSLTQI